MGPNCLQSVAPSSCADTRHSAAAQVSANRPMTRRVDSKAAAPAVGGVAERGRRGGVALMGPGGPWAARAPGPLELDSPYALIPVINRDEHRSAFQGDIGCLSHAGDGIAQRCAPLVGVRV